MRIDRALKTGFIIYLLARVACYIVNSFSWPMDGDISFLFYISRLMNEHGFIPYRDVHETSFFGTFIFYTTLTRWIGYSTVAFHVADTLFFLLLSAITYGLLKPFGRLAALLAIGLFGEVYFHYGIGVHLQRDFVALLPVAAAWFLVAMPDKTYIKTRCFLTGVLFGIASCIKPQFGLGLIVVLIFFYLQNKKNSSIERIPCALIFGLSLCGFTLVWLSGLCWLYCHGVLHHFLDMVFNYLPEYSSINGRNYARNTEDALSGAAKWYAGMMGLFALPLALSFFGILKDTITANIQKLLALCALVMWLLYLSYVPMAGKYWEYHILPSYYFLSVCLSLVAASVASKKSGALLSVFIFSAWLVLAWFTILEKSLWIAPHNDQKFNARMESGTEDLANFLTAHLQKGDTVQSHVSHTHGPIFPALLRVDAMPATPYLENYLLYHDVDKPFVKNAREQFLTTLENKPPRFIIAGPTVFNFRGERTESAFQPFEDWLAANYRPVHYSPDLPGQSISETYIVYEHQAE